MDTEDAVHKDWSRMKRKVAAHRQRLDWVRSLQRAKGTSETGTVGTRGPMDKCRHRKWRAKCQEPLHRPIVWDPV